MTPKEKAEKLYVSFYSKTMISRADGYGKKIIALSSALLCVDEIIESGTWEHIDWKYWQDVKREIERL